MAKPGRTGFDQHLIVARRRQVDFGNLQRLALAEWMLLALLEQDGGLHFHQDPLGEDSLSLSAPGFRAALSVFANHRPIP